MSNKPFTLDLKTSKNGIYLSQQQVDLLTIVSLKDKEAIRKFIEEKCGQFPNKKAEDVVDLENDSVEECKRQLFEKYRDTLVIYLENDQMTRTQKAQEKLKKMGLKPEQVAEVLDFINYGDENGAYAFLEQQYGTEFVTNFNHFMSDDFENIKDESVTYELISKLDQQIRKDSLIDTIIIATGKYDNTMYPTGDGEQFDPYLITKGLDYCKSTGKHMRYHALFDYAHLQKLIKSGKGLESHDEILASMKTFVRETMKFISSNNEQMPDGSMRINVIEVFNELVEYNKAESDREQYDMAWQKYFGITIEEIMSCFDGIEKPEGLSYMYNETMLEESLIRRQKVESVLAQIMAISPDFLDKFGDQMHLEQLHAIQGTEQTPYGKLGEVEQTFDLLKRVQEKGLAIECTEFDIHIDSTTMEKVLIQLEQGKITEEQIRNMKREWISTIARVANERNINFDRTTYWSILDVMDHNLVRANKQRQIDGKPPLATMYAGLYGNGENLGSLDKTEISKLHDLLQAYEHTEITSENVQNAYGIITRTKADREQREQQAEQL